MRLRGTACAAAGLLLVVAMGCTGGAADGAPATSPAAARTTGESPRATPTPT
ncbi:peptidase S9, partial [Streptomyces cahuitamycinicus]